MMKLQSVLIINKDTFQALTENKILSNTKYQLIQNSDSCKNVGQILSDLKPAFILLDVSMERKKDLQDTLEKIIGYRIPVISISGNKHGYRRYSKEEVGRIVCVISSGSDSLLSEILIKPNIFNLSLS